MSAGLRYEVQNNLGGLGNWAPRVGIAWGLDGRPNRPAKSVIRAGFGCFYDRIPISVTLNNLRYNGTNQQSYLILNPAFYPTVPPAAALETNQQPQQFRPAYSGMQAPRLYQASVGARTAAQPGIASNADVDPQPWCALVELAQHQCADPRQFTRPATALFAS